MAYVPKPIKCSPQLLEQDLTGKNYIITGANSGVGLGTAEQLLKQGANVFLLVGMKQSINLHYQILIVITCQGKQVIFI